MMEKTIRVSKDDKEKIIKATDISGEYDEIKVKQLNWKSLFSVFQDFENNPEEDRSADIVYVMSDGKITTEILEMSTGKSIDEISEKYSDTEAQKIVDAVCEVHKNFLTRWTKHKEREEQRIKEMLEIINKTQSLHK